MICGHLTSLDSVDTRSTKIILETQLKKPLAITTPFHGLVGNQFQDEALNRLHSIPEWKMREPALDVCMAGKDLTGLQRKEVSDPEKNCVSFGACIIPIFDL